MRKKNLLGFGAKRRAPDEVNAAYNVEGLQAGHKMRIIQQLEVEVQEHLDRMKNLNKEIMGLQKEAKVSVDASTPRPPTPNAQTDQASAAPVGSA